LPWFILIIALLPICLKSEGKKTTLGFATFAICVNESKYLICIAAWVFKISAAFLISLADWTSAWALIILPSAYLLAVAGADKVFYKSALIYISYINTLWAYTPQFAVGPLIKSNKWFPTFSLSSKASYKVVTPNTSLKLVWVSSLMENSSLLTENKLL